MKLRSSSERNLTSDPDRLPEGFVCRLIPFLKLVAGRSAVKHCRACAYSALYYNHFNWACPLAVMCLKS